MTLDEAIKHAEEVAEENENNAQIWHKQTKNRLVDFCDKAIQAENNCIKCAEEHRQLAEWLKELKQLREQVRWIPVSERLPEIHQDVLLSLRILDVDVRFRAKTEPYFYCHGNYIEPQNVLAWQSKPEPYKAESEEV